MLVQIVEICDDHTNEVIWGLKGQTVMSVMYPGLLQTSTKELYAIIINGKKPLTIAAKAPS